MDYVNAIDALVLIWLFAHLLLGARAGIFAQLSRFAALCAAGIAGYSFPVVASQFAASQWGWHVPFQETLCSVTLFLGVYFLTRLFLFPLNSLLVHEKSVLYRPNRWMGASFGLLSASILALVLLSAVNWVDKRTSGSLSEALPLQTSSAMAVVREADVFARVHGHERDILRFIANPADFLSQSALQTDIHLSDAILNLRSFLGNEILGWVQAEEWTRVLNHPRTLFLLESKYMRVSHLPKAVLSP